MSMSLVDFDDKTPYELIDILNKVLGSLDEDQRPENHTNETPDAHSERVCQFLAVIGFPGDFKRDLKQGDKKTISNILWWIL